MCKPVILCVDDEKIVLQSLKAQLKSAFGDAYLYEVAEDGDEAIELIKELKEEGMKIILLVSDWLMPGIKGDELLIRVDQEFPNIIKIMLTGQANEEAIARAKQEANIHSCLYKPWAEEELIQTIQSALKKL